MALLPGLAALAVSGSVWGSISGTALKGNRGSAGAHPACVRRLEPHDRSVSKRKKKKTPGYFPRTLGVEGVPKICGQRGSSKALG